jgi:CubicO group peptidase (beta-lactamase class C family)
MKQLISISLILLFSGNLSEANIWPSEKWNKLSFNNTKLDAKKFDVFRKYLFNSENDHITDGIVIIKNGNLLYEQYENGYSEKTSHLFWSAAKSFTNALVGIAIKKELLTLETKSNQFYQNHKDKDISVKNLLQMSSGIDWNEGYEGNPLRSTVVKMLYTDGFLDMAKYVSSIETHSKADQVFRYSSGDTNLLMGILRQALGNSKYELFPWNELFIPLGITSAVWERDHQKTFVGSSYLYMTPKDAARFGLLFLRKGIWKKKRILDSSWIDFSTRLAPSFSKTKRGDKFNNFGYGAHWWLNLPIPNKGLKRPYPDAPSDLFLALGHHGQSISIIPSLDMIIVRTAEDKEKPIDRNKMYKLLLESFEK